MRKPPKHPYPDHPSNCALNNGGAECDCGIVPQLVADDFIVTVVEDPLEQRERIMREESEIAEELDTSHPKGLN